MSTRVDLRAQVDLACGGSVELAIAADFSALDAAGHELVGHLLGLIGRHAAAGNQLPNQGGTDDGPDADGITQPPHDSPEERRADRAGAAGAADDAPDAGPEAPPAPQQPNRRSGRRSAPATNGTKGPRSKPARRGGLGDLGVRLLRALHELGGEVFDPSGRSATTLFVAVGITDGNQQKWARTVLMALEEAGHVTRTVNGKRTSRIALTPSGLAIVDGQGGEAAGDDELDEPQPSAPTSTSTGVTADCIAEQHVLCMAVPGRCACGCHDKARSRAA